MSALPIPAQWTPDCQGKWDFDGDLVCISTRYWPQGGGFWLIESGKGINENPTPEVRPSATSTVYLGSTSDDYYDSAIPLARFECEGETEAQVKAAVEKWAREQFARIHAALFAAFPNRPTK